MADFPQSDVSGRTRTKDKYRVVYSDHQRLELEKEFHYSRYITIRCLSRVARSECYIVVRRRKAELAQALNLTERQVGWVGSATIKREACLTKENPHTAKKIKCLKVIFDEHDNPNFFVPHEKFMRLLHRRPFYLLLC